MAALSGTVIGNRLISHRRFGIRSQWSVINASLSVHQGFTSPAASPFRPKHSYPASHAPVQFAANKIARDHPSPAAILSSAETVSPLHPAPASQSTPTRAQTFPARPAPVEILLLGPTLRTPPPVCSSRPQ